MASKRYIDEIFTIQKTAIRYLFGDYDSFLDKFCTAARTRPYDEQQLGIRFYQKEHAKPLFNKHKIPTVYNLCKYMAVNQIGKIITTKSPTVYNLCKYMAVNQIGKIITTKSPTVYNLCKYMAVNQIGKIITTKSPTVYNLCKYMAVNQIGKIITTKITDCI